MFSSWRNKGCSIGRHKLFGSADHCVIPIDQWFGSSIVADESQDLEDSFDLLVQDLLQVKLKPEHA